MNPFILLSYIVVITIFPLISDQIDNNYIQLKKTTRNQKVVTKKYKESTNFVIIVLFFLSLKTLIIIRKHWNKNIII